MSYHARVLAAAVERDWIDWALVAFTVVGVAIAVWQSYRSVGLAQAAKSATQRAEVHFTSSQLIAVVPTLQAQRRSLRDALATSPADVEKVLDDWSSHTNELLGMLAERAGVPGDLLKSLNDLVNALGSAQRAVNDGDARLQKGTTKDVNAAAIDVVGHMSRLAGKLKNYVPGEGIDA